MRVVVTTMRVAGDKEGEGGMAMAMVKRMTGKQRGWQQRGQRQRWQGWGARMRAIARAARAMAIAMKRVIARMRAIASNNTNKTTATETTTTQQIQQRGQRR